MKRTRTRRRLPRPNERGVALIMTLAVVIALSLLGSGLILLTTTEVFVTRNEAFGREAFWAAEAGLKHARRVLAEDLGSLNDITRIYQNDGGTAPDSGIALGRHPTLGFTLPSPRTGVAVAGELAGGGRTRYQVFIYNNFGLNELDPNGAVPPRATMLERDGVVLLRSVGFSALGTRRILEESVFLENIVTDAAHGQRGGGAGGLPAQSAP